MTLKEVEGSEGKANIYRSVGRMFILSSKEDIAAELKANLKQITAEQGRQVELKKAFEAKKEHFTKQLKEAKN